VVLDAVEFWLCGAAVELLFMSVELDEAFGVVEVEPAWPEVASGVAVDPVLVLVVDEL